MYMKNKMRELVDSNTFIHVQVGENILEDAFRIILQLRRILQQESILISLNLLWKLTCSSSHLSGPNKFSNIIALRYEP